MENNATTLQELLDIGYRVKASRFARGHRKFFILSRSLDEWAVYYNHEAVYLKSRRDCMVFALGREWIPDFLVVDDDEPFNLDDEPFSYWFEGG